MAMDGSGNNDFSGPIMAAEALPPLQGNLCKTNDRYFHYALCWVTAGAGLTVQAIECIMYRILLRNS
jgi:hypothetical protein